MRDILFSPPVTFLIYIVLVGLIYASGRALAGPSHETEMKTSTYSGGEAPPSTLAAPGYRPFFVIALFFATLHLGVLMLGSGGLTPMKGIYLLGLLLALIALILG